MTSAVPTQINMISTAIPPATKPMLTRRRVRRASQRLANAPNNSVASTTRMTGAGNPCRRGRLGVHPRRRLLVEPLRVGQDRAVCISDDASDRYDEPTGLPARLLVRAVSTSPVYTDEFGVDPAEQLHHRLVGQPAGRPGDRDRRRR